MKTKQTQLDKLRSQYWFAICANASVEQLAKIAEKIKQLEVREKHEQS